MSWAGHKKAHQGTPLVFPTNDPLCRVKPTILPGVSKPYHHDTFDDCLDGSLCLAREGGVVDGKTRFLSRSKVDNTTHVL